MTLFLLVTYKIRILNGEIMNKRFDIIIKLSKDNVYDLYLNDEWVVSRVSHENILDEAKKLIESNMANK